MDVNPLDPTGIRDSTKGYSTPVRLKHDQYGKFPLFVMGKKQMFSGNLSSSTKKWVTEPFFLGPISQQERLVFKVLQGYSEN